jgi:small subunit ribosomal protein S4
MARQTGPKCRLCRREGMKLFLKGERCVSAKCALERRQSPPGQRVDRRRRKVGTYAMQLREKQRLKRLFGLYEGGFHRLLTKAESQAGNTGENFLRLLERRLDNVVVRMGFAASHAAAREMVAHGHVHINGRRVDVASYLVKAGDEVSVATAKMREPVLACAKAARDRGSVASWVEVSEDDTKGVVKALPNKEDISLPVDEGLVITFYSK